MTSEEGRRPPQFKMSDSVVVGGLGKSRRVSTTSSMISNRMKKFSSAAAPPTNLGELSPLPLRRASTMASPTPGMDLSNRLAFTFCDSVNDLASDLAAASTKNSDTFSMSPKLRRQVDNSDETSATRRRTSVRKNSTSDRITMFESRNKFSARGDTIRLMTKLTKTMESAESCTEDEEKSAASRKNSRNQQPHSPCDSPTVARRSLEEQQNQHPLSGWQRSILDKLPTAPTTVEEAEAKVTLGRSHPEKTRRTSLGGDETNTKSIREEDGTEIYRRPSVTRNRVFIKRVESFSERDEPSFDNTPSPLQIDSIPSNCSSNKPSFICKVTIEKPSFRIENQTPLLTNTTTNSRSVDQSDLSDPLLQFDSNVPDSVHAEKLIDEKSLMYERRKADSLSNDKSLADDLVETSRIVHNKDESDVYINTNDIAPLYAPKLGDVTQTVNTAMDSSAEVPHDSDAGNQNSLFSQTVTPPKSIQSSTVVEEDTIDRTTLYDNFQFNTSSGAQQEKDSAQLLCQQSDLQKLIDDCTEAMKSVDFSLGEEDENNHRLDPVTRNDHDFPSEIPGDNRARIGDIAENRLEISSSSPKQQQTEFQTTEKGSAKETIITHSPPRTEPGAEGKFSCYDKIPTTTANANAVNSCSTPSSENEKEPDKNSQNRRSSPKSSDSNTDTSESCEKHEGKERVRRRKLTKRRAKTANAKTTLTSSGQSKKCRGASDNSDGDFTPKSYTSDEYNSSNKKLLVLKNDHSHDAEKGSVFRQGSEENRAENYHLEQSVHTPPDLKTDQKHSKEREIDQLKSWSASWCADVPLRMSSVDRPRRTYSDAGSGGGGGVMNGPDFLVSKIHVTKVPSITHPFKQYSRSTTDIASNINQQNKRDVRSDEEQLENNNDVVHDHILSKLTRKPFGLYPPIPKNEQIDQYLKDIQTTKLSLNDGDMKDEHTESTIEPMSPLLNVEGI